MKILEPLYKLVSLFTMAGAINCCEIQLLSIMSRFEFHCNSKTSCVRFHPLGLSYSNRLGFPRKHLLMVKRQIYWTFVVLPS
jgi:hypothetical protein